MRRPRATRSRRSTHFSKMLQDPNASLADKQTALRFIVHLVGDLHQPLHVGKCCDKGGNDVKVTWFGKPTNLHAVWDFAAGRRRAIVLHRARGEARAAHERPTDVIEWWDINPRDWISESGEHPRHALSDRRRHAQADEGQEAEEGRAAASRSVLWLRLSSFTPLMEQRLSQGGVRLAAYLNAIFAEPQPLPERPPR